jgi:hypothetical protein
VKDMRILVTFISIIIHNGGVGFEFLKNKELKETYHLFAFLPKIGLEDIVSSCLTLHTGEM